MIAFFPTGSCFFVALLTFSHSYGLVSSTQALAPSQPLIPWLRPGLRSHVKSPRRASGLRMQQGRGGGDYRGGERGKFRSWEEENYGRGRETGGRQRGEKGGRQPSGGAAYRVQRAAKAASSPMMSPPTFDGSTPPDLEGENFFSKREMAEIGASEEIIQCIKDMGMAKPSKIQALSYGTVLEGHHCVIADQTGSGKTLAYLLPLVQRLRQEEAEGKRGRARPGCPRVLVLAPTAELAQQVNSVAQRLSKVARFRCTCFTGGNARSTRTQVKMLNEGVDMLVATPGRVSTLLETGALSLEDAGTVVLDEVDVLYLDETFKLAPIGTQAPDDSQFLFVTATLPKEVTEMLKLEFPGVKFVQGPGLHRVAPGLEEVVVDCSGPPEEVKNPTTGMQRKREALFAQLERRSSILRTVVFCNTIRSCREVENMLKRQDRSGGKYAVLPYHSAMDSKQANENMRQFMRENAMRRMILVCTDRGSRGMDFDRCEVGHVVLFDFPRDPIEYMRRVGRTARAGRKGVVTVLAWGRQVPLVREIIQGSKQGRRLLSLDD